MNRNILIVLALFFSACQSKTTTGIPGSDSTLLAVDTVAEYGGDVTSYGFVFESDEVQFRQEETIVIGTLMSAGMGDCFHLKFSCGDFGSAVPDLNGKEKELWQSLTNEDQNGNVTVNPDYLGKAFEIRYRKTKGSGCSDPGEESVEKNIPSVYGFRMVGFSQSDFVAFGWSILDQAEGDLNKDGIADKVLILENSVENEDRIKPRAVFVLFKDQDQRFTLACRGNKAILDSQSGGVMGDPYNGMKIDKNVLRIDFSGGSREKWALTYRYRYQNGDFEMIGATNLGDDGDAQTYIYDYNLSSGKMILDKKDSQNPANNTSVTKVVKQPKLPSLSTFEPMTLQIGDGISF